MILIWDMNSTSDGGVDIRNEALANVRMAYVNKEPGKIICLIWGSSSVLRYVHLASQRIHLRDRLDQGINKETAQND